MTPMYTLALPFQTSTREDLIFESLQFIMPKGDRKRAEHGCFFKTGNSPSPTVTRVQQEPVAGPSRVQQGDTAQASTSRTSDPTYNLRPRELKTNPVAGNRIVNVEKMLEMMNSVYNRHRTVNDNVCSAIDLIIVREVKQGLAWKFQFKCQNCHFVSRLYKCYAEIENTKSAAINTNFAMGIMDTPMGVDRARLLLTSMDIPPPARSHLQTLTQTVSSSIVELNEDDMSDKLKRVVEHNVSRGVVNPKHIHVSMDTRYNASRMKSSYKPGQSSSQAYSVAIENETDQQYIISMAVENKLCWVGAWMKNRGYDIRCPGGHAECTANIAYMQPHSERRLAYNIASNLSVENYWLHTVTTDGDTKAHLGLKDFYAKLDKTWVVSRKADPNHLATSQQRMARKADFSASMFPSARTKTEKQAAMLALSKDIRARSNKIVSELMHRGDGDITKMLHTLPSVRRATVECYSGNCSNCPDQSLVCAGVGEDCWWVKSAFLPTRNITHLEMNENDKNILEVLLEMRLSETAVNNVSLKSTTQKCEAFNRAAVSTMPKEVNFSSTFSGRLAAQVLKSNNSVADAMQRKVRCISKTTLSDRTSQHLRQISKSQKYNKKYKSTAAYKKRRVANRARMEYEHQLQGDKVETDYVKFQLSDTEHTYATKKRRKRLR